MIPYEVYRLVHFFGIFSTLVAIGGTCLHVINGGTRATNPNRRLLAMVHGIGMFLIILGGFGMLARLDIGFPVWVMAKLGVWVVIGGAITLPYASSSLARLLIIGAPLLAIIAGTLALYKPF